MCQSRVLSGRETITVSKCMDCGTFYIWCQNIFLNFTGEKFKSFREAVVKLDEEECSFSFPDGERRVIINTPVPEISFAFSHDELNTFRTVLEEAAFMCEVYDLMV